jgi:hypothetical protein
MTPIPMPLRAAAGLAAVAIDEARRLPRRVVGLPVLAVGTALQVSLKAQQRYAELVARGDQLLGQLRGADAGTPPWARFDEDEVPAARPPSAFDTAAMTDDTDYVDTNYGDTDGEYASAAEPAADTDDLLELDDIEDRDELADLAELDGFAAGDRAQAAHRASAVTSLDGPDAAGFGEPTDPAGPADIDEVEELAAEFDVDEPGEADALDGELAEAAELAELADAITVPAGPAAEEIEAAAAGLDLGDAVPLAGYDGMSIPQLRARLRRLTERQLVDLIRYEEANGQRPAYLTMLSNRLATVRGG